MDPEFRYHSYSQSTEVFEGCHRKSILKTDILTVIQRISFYFAVKNGLNIVETEFLVEWLFCFRQNGFFCFQ